MVSKIEVDTVVNQSGDQDSGLDLSTNDVVAVKTANTERMRINADGRMGIGTTDIDAPIDIVDGTEYIRISNTTSDNTSKTGGLAIRHRDNEEEDINLINGIAGNSNNIVTIGGGDYIGSLNAATIIRFFTADNRTTVDGTERMQINGDGVVMVGTTDTNPGNNTSGSGLVFNSSDGKFSSAVDGSEVMVLNRMSSDGDVLLIRQAGSTEGIISVSGSTVSYGGFTGLHESSGIITNTPVGTVVSTIDELDVYPDTQDGEDHPKKGKTRADHPKVKVSDSVGDKRVYGVVNNFNTQGKVNVASVGVGSIKVTGSCVGGDLLESNGDGTAKVQSDDIVRSKTIGKVTIGNSSTDVKLVSCVLYCG